MAFEEESWVSEEIDAGGVRGVEERASKVGIGTSNSSNLGLAKLLNSAIFRRDLPILQGTTLVLAFFFMMLNLTVDVVQTMVDPRIKRG